LSRKRRRRGRGRDRKNGAEMTMKGNPKAKNMPIDIGLVGFFGHTYKDIEGEMRIQYQFRIIRPLSPDRWVVQLYSALDGTPNCLKVYSEDFLLGDAVNLYPDEDTWNWAYSAHARRFSHS
jgi:hypothetical protein